MTRNSALVLATLALAAASRSTLFAQCELSSVQPSSLQTHDAYGTSVAISADLAVVGAFGDDAGAMDAGAVYVFERQGTTWLTTAKLLANDPSTNAYLGRCVATHGETIVASVRAPAFAAYVFERIGGVWTQTAKLVDPTLDVGSLFGMSLAVSADTILVGAPEDDHLHPKGGGLVVIYRRLPSGWVKSGALAVTGLSFDDSFGWSVAIDGDRAVVGNTQLYNGVEPGAAYVFEGVTSVWTHVATLVPADATGKKSFGSSVALKGSTILVGANFDQISGLGSGSAYVYEKTPSGWTQSAKLIPTDSATFGVFGVSVAMSEAGALVGSAYGSQGGGALYSFANGPAGWHQVAHTVGSDTLPGDKFGESIAASGDLVLVGAPGHDGAGQKAGKAYLLSITGSAFESLAASTATVSLTSGGAQQLELKTCLGFGGLPYLVAGSLTGTSPGVVLEGVTLHLVPDAYTLFTVANPNTPPLLQQTLGVLSAAGEGSAAIDVAAVAGPELVGAEAWHAYVVIDPALGKVVFASNAVKLLVVP